MKSRKNSENPQDPPATAGGRLDWVLKAAGLTGKEAALLLGISESHLSRVRNGEAPVSAQVMQKLSVELNIPRHWLRTGLGASPLAESIALYATVSQEGNVMIASVPVIERVAFVCGSCHADVAPGLHVCHRCAARLNWTEEQLRRAL